MVSKKPSIQCMEAIFQLLTAHFNAVGNQDKMIVSQARHLWNNSKAALHFPNDRPIELLPIMVSISS